MARKFACWPGAGALWLVGLVACLGACGSGDLSEIAVLAPDVGGGDASQIVPPDATDATNANQPNAVRSPNAATTGGNGAAGRKPPVAPGAVKNGAHAGSTVSLQALACSSGSASGYLPVYANVDLAAKAFAIDRAVIVFHGAGRNAADTAGFGLSAVAKAGGAVVPGNTLVITPFFAASASDIPADFSKRPALVWSNGEYMAGGVATGGASIASFVAVDTLLRTFADQSRFPALKTVYVIGHSGGGQTTQRYAVGGAEAQRWGAAEPNLVFALANPSSYAYFDASRPDGKGSFAAVTGGSCPGFNDWKYGLQSMPAYFSSQAASSRLKAYSLRNVTYVLGTADNDPNSSSMDRSCEAELQGNTRLVRGRNYAAYLKSKQQPLLHTSCEVPGVGHDDQAMLTSACMLSVLRK